MAAISVIVCTHNDSVYLPVAFASLIPKRQAGVEVEVIVVDDASTEPMNSKAAEMIEHYGFRYFRHRVNRGLAASRNTGIACASHEFIIPLDADDWLFPNSLAALAAGMDTNTDVVYGYMKQGVDTHYPVREPLTKAHFLDSNPLFCSSLFKKDLWKFVGGYPEKPSPMYEDWAYWASCFKDGARFKYVPVLVYNHTLRPDAMCAGLNQNHEYFKQLATECLR